VTIAAHDGDAKGQPDCPEDGVGGGGHAGLPVRDGGGGSGGDRVEASPIPYRPGAGGYLAGSQSMDHPASALVRFRSGDQPVYASLEDHDRRATS
jgi:hypothetical protein